MKIGTFLLHTSLIFVFVAGGAGCATLKDKAMALHERTPCGRMMSEMAHGPGESCCKGASTLDKETMDEPPAEQQEGEVRDEASPTQQGMHEHHMSPTEG